MRLATYNTEWFNALFDDAGRMLFDNELSSRFQITRRQQLSALGTVFRALDADAVMIIEAPDTNSKRATVTALETFATANHLRARKAIIGYVSDTEQEIGFLYDPDALTARHAPQGDAAQSSTAPRFDSQFRLDLNGDGDMEIVRFSKPPLELEITTTAGHPLRLIGVHAKSKAPHGATSEKEFTRISIENRRKQLAECLWLRARIDAHFAAGDSLIVMGDFNDGPGLDEYEKLFGHSGIEVVLGTTRPAANRLYDPHASLALTKSLGMRPTTARFWHPKTKQYFEALLDFIMVSPDIAAKQPEWRIWHPFNNPAVTQIPDLADALLSASDHFPVTLDVEM
ncbi:MAG: endonuclease/exonuclease/phosphatase family protein [Cypionkella sp.]